MSRIRGSWVTGPLGLIVPIVLFAVAISGCVLMLNRHFPDRVDNHSAVIVSTWVEEGFGRSAQTLVEFPDGTRATRRGILGKEGDEVMTWREDD